MIEFIKKDYFEGEINEVDVKEKNKEVIKKLKETDSFRSIDSYLDGENEKWQEIEEELKIHFLGTGAKMTVSIPMLSVVIQDIAIIMGDFVEGEAFGFDTEFIKKGNILLLNEKDSIIKITLIESVEYHDFYDRGIFQIIPINILDKISIDFLLYEYLGDEDYDKD